MQEKHTEEKLFWQYKDYCDEITECGTNNRKPMSYKEFCRRKQTEV